MTIVYILYFVLIALAAAFYFFLRYINKSMREMVESIREVANAQNNMSHIVQLQMEVIQKANQIIMAGNATKEDLMQFKSLLEEMQKACDGCSKEQ